MREKQILSPQEPPLLGHLSVKRRMSLAFLFTLITYISICLIFELLM